MDSRITEILTSLLRAICVISLITNNIKNNEIRIFAKIFKILKLKIMVTQKADKIITPNLMALARPSFRVNIPTTNNNVKLVLFIYGSNPSGNNGIIKIIKTSKANKVICRVDFLNSMSSKNFKTLKLFTINEYSKSAS